MRMPLPPAFCVWCWKLNARLSLAALAVDRLVDHHQAECPKDRSQNLFIKVDPHCTLFTGGF